MRHLALWLRRAVAIVAVTIGLPVMILIGAALSSREQGDGLVRLETRTRAGPLTGNSPVTGSRIALLGRLPSSTSASKDGYRIAIEPADESRSYALAVWRDGSSSTAANAVLLIVENQRILSRYGFLVPPDVFRAFVARLDALLEYHGGDPGQMCIDGTPVGFERRHGDVLFSGWGIAWPLIAGSAPSLSPWRVSTGRKRGRPGLRTGIVPKIRTRKLGRAMSDPRPHDASASWARSHLPNPPGWGRSNR